MTETTRAEQHLGETKGISNHDHDLIHDLSLRLDSIWRYDQYIANAEQENATAVKELWQDVKAQDLKMIERFKELIREHVKQGDF